MHVKIWETLGWHRSLSKTMRAVCKWLTSRKRARGGQEDKEATSVLSQWGLRDHQWRVRSASGCKPAVLAVLWLFVVVPQIWIWEKQCPCHSITAERIQETARVMWKTAPRPTSEGTQRTRGSPQTAVERKSALDREADFWRQDAVLSSVSG